jgi:hypothetical protein
MVALQQDLKPLVYEALSYSCMRPVLGHTHIYTSRFLAHPHTDTRTPCSHRKKEKNKPEPLLLTDAVVRGHMYSSATVVLD